MTLTLFRRFLLLLITALLTHAGSAAGQVSTALQDHPLFHESGKLTVAVPGFENPPFFFSSNGQLQGLDIEIAREFGRRLKVDIVFERSAKNFDDVVALVTQGKADIALGKISRTFTRSQSVLFTAPYLEMPHALLVNRIAFAALARERPAAQVMQQFTGTIGVIAHSSYVDYARKYFPQAKVIEFPDWNSAVEAVARGSIVAAYRDAFEVRRLFKIRPRLALTLRSIVIADIKDRISIAVAPNNYQLQILLNVFLEEMNVRTTVDQIFSRYAHSLQ